MNRLEEFLQDLRTMPGVNGAFLCHREGIIATTINDFKKLKKVGRIYLNVLSGAFSLGHFIQEIYCSFDNAVLMFRPVSRGCVLAAVCKSGVSVRLVDISLTMTAKSIEEELNGMTELPPVIAALNTETGQSAEVPSAVFDGSPVDDGPEVQEAVETNTEG